MDFSHCASRNREQQQQQQQGFQGFGSLPMAGVIEMDVDQVDSSNKAASSNNNNRSSSTSTLAINRSSSKISKSTSSSSSSTLRRPIVSQQTKPMPTSKVYNTDPMGFRNLVQELTGYSPANAGDPPPPPPPTDAVRSPPAVSTTANGAVTTVNGAVATSATAVGGAARPANTTRLQRMAPPPLSPSFSFSFKQQSQADATATTTAGGGVVSPSAHPLSPLSKRVTPMPVLSFSPLPQLSPTDNIWANFESPNTAALKKLAQSIVDGNNGATTGGNGDASKLAFPWSPTFQACFGMPSPGIASFPELFPDVKMLESPDNMNTNSSSSGFSFPEVRD